jgi:two-component system OmpR family response regulator
MKLLVVEDDPVISDVLARGLRSHSYDVDAALDGELGLSMALNGGYALLILDIRLPKMNGVDLCAAVRAVDRDTPIIMLSALSSPSDTGMSMAAGANAYIVKPFDFDLLVDCIRSLTGLGPARHSVTIAIADLVLDLTRETLHRGGGLINLTPHEFSLLKYFASHWGELVTYDAICSDVLNMRFDPRSNIVDVLMRRLQLKIDEGRPEAMIELVHGVGYRFKGL